MKFRVHVRNVHSGRDWWEEYDEAVTDPLAWAMATVARFNETLRPNEAPRELLGVETIDTSTHHHWQKQSLTMQVDRDNRMFDVYQCTECGITGKRYGLNRVTRDPEFKAEVYAYCNTAKDQLDKLESEGRGKTQFAKIRSLPPLSPKPNRVSE